MQMVFRTVLIIFHLLVLVVLPPFSSAAQADGIVPVAASLTAGDEASPWTSSSGDFAFGFQQLEDKDNYLLSIWFDKIPEKTIVWYANGGSPAPRGSGVQLTAHSGLVLKSPSGQEIWRSNITVGQVARGVMNGTGNFVLESSNSDMLWQSFDNPTDTLLPTQTMERGDVLFSRLTETNFSRGRFQLRFLENGNLILNPVDLHTNLAYDSYYASGTSDSANSSNSGYLLVFEVLGAMYILTRSGDAHFLTTLTVPPAEFYHRATLNFDGVFAEYSYPKSSTGSQNWTPIWSQPDNICVDINGTLGSGACGYNSICRLNDLQRPMCSCPAGYSLLDSYEEYGSCKPDFVISCDEDQMEDSYSVEELKDTDWPKSDYEQFKPFSEKECRDSCLHDCLCAAAIFRNNSCSKKKLPLSNGRVDSRVNGTAFLKMKNPGRRKSRSTLIITESVLLGTSVFINVILILAFCIGFFWIYRKKVAKTRKGGVGMETSVHSFTYKELAEATSGFREELGRGAFGVVYKGWMPIGSSNVVAVKELDGVVAEGEKEFRTEVNAIGQKHHKNLVQLLGFCDDGQHRLLVYEYVSNGTLAEILYGSSKPTWTQRTQIACGIARGLLYLHEECSTPIIHCDIKPQNILLDGNFNARISDFGLAKLLAMDHSETHTAVRGTRGYIAPEWFSRTPITMKVDVYSFGVMLLEIICCRRSVDAELHGERVILIDWAYDCYQEGALTVLVEDEMEALSDLGNLDRMVKVAIWCIQEDPSLRPTMRNVTQMLEGVVEAPLPPNSYSFSLGN